MSLNLSTFGAFKHINSDECIVLDDAQIRQLQSVLVTILDDIVSVCEKYHINYFLGGGTALGAVRHHGFIPWDDDIDINMPRKDYEIFVPAFRKEFKDKYWLHTPKDTPDYGLLLTRVRLKGTCIRTKEDFLNPDECGALVDIFVIENTFDNPLLRKLHGIGSLGFGFLLSCRNFYRNRKFWLKLIDPGSDLQKAFRIKTAIGFLTAVFSLSFWTRLADRWNSLCKNDQSRYVSGCAGRLHFFGELYERNGFCNVRKADFEGRCCNVSKDVEGYLTHMYGDWEKMPEEKDREKHVVFEFKL